MSKKTLLYQPDKMKAKKKADFINALTATIEHRAQRQDNQRQQSGFDSKVDTQEIDFNPYQEATNFDVQESQTQELHPDQVIIRNCASPHFQEGDSSPQHNQDHMQQIYENDAEQFQPQPSFSTTKQEDQEIQEIEEATENTSFSRDESNMPATLQTFNDDNIVVRKQTEIVNPKAKCGSPISKPRVAQKFSLAQQLVNNSVSDRLGRKYEAVQTSSSKPSPMKKQRLTQDDRMRLLTGSTVLQQKYGLSRPRPQPKPEVTPKRRGTKSSRSPLRIVERHIDQEQFSLGNSEPQNLQIESSAEFGKRQSADLVDQSPIKHSPSQHTPVKNQPKKPQPTFVKSNFRQAYKPMTQSKSTATLQTKSVHNSPKRPKPLNFSRPKHKYTPQASPLNHRLGPSTQKHSFQRQSRCTSKQDHSPRSSHSGSWVTQNMLRQGRLVSSNSKERKAPQTTKAYRTSVGHHESVPVFPQVNLQQVGDLKHKDDDEVSYPMTVSSKPGSPDQRGSVKLWNNSQQEEDSLLVQVQPYQDPSALQSLTVREMHTQETQNTFDSRNTQVVEVNRFSMGSNGTTIRKMDSVGTTVTNLDSFRSQPGSGRKTTIGAPSFMEREKRKQKVIEEEKPQKPVISKEEAERLASRLHEKGMALKNKREENSRRQLEQKAKEVLDSCTFKPQKIALQKRVTQMSYPKPSLTPRSARNNAKFLAPNHVPSNQGGYDTSQMEGSIFEQPDDIYHRQKQWQHQVQRKIEYNKTCIKATELAEVTHTPEFFTNPVTITQMSNASELAFQKHQDRMRKANHDRDTVNKKLDLRHIERHDWTPTRQARERSRSKEERAKLVNTSPVRSVSNSLEKKVPKHVPFMSTTPRHLIPEAPLGSVRTPRSPPRSQLLQPSLAFQPPEDYSSSRIMNLQPVRQEYAVRQSNSKVRDYISRDSPSKTSRVSASFGLKSHHEIDSFTHGDSQIYGGRDSTTTVKKLPSDKTDNTVNLDERSYSGPFERPVSSRQDTRQFEYKELMKQLHESIQEI